MKKERTNKRTKNFAICNVCVCIMLKLRETADEYIIINITTIYIRFTIYFHFIYQNISGERNYVSVSLSCVYACMCNGLQIFSSFSFSSFHFYAEAC